MYPFAARRAGIEGRASVGMEIGSDGKVAKVWLLTSTGQAVLDRAALENVERWRFEPTSIPGGGRFRQTITFELRRTSR
ncbi:MAG: energy transducer TonB [Planctomycetota bacterium]